MLRSDSTLGQLFRLLHTFLQLTASFQIYSKLLSRPGSLTTKIEHVLLQLLPHGIDCYRNEQLRLCIFYQHSLLHNSIAIQCVNSHRLN